MNLATVSALLGMMMPALVATVVRVRWPAWVKEIVALGLSAGVGVLTAWLHGDLHGLGWLEAAVVVATASEASYRLYWKDSDVGTLLERWWPWAAKPAVTALPDGSASGGSADS